MSWFRAKKAKHPSIIYDRAESRPEHVPNSSDNQLHFHLQKQATLHSLCWTVEGSRNTWKKPKHTHRAEKIQAPRRKCLRPAIGCIGEMDNQKEKRLDRRPGGGQQYN